MDRWEIFLWVVAAGFCGLFLVRLMLRRRDQMYEEIQKQLARQKKRSEKPKEEGRRPG